MAIRNPSWEEKQIKKLDDASSIGAITALQAAWTAIQQSDPHASAFFDLEPALITAIARRDLEITDWILSQIGEPTPKAVISAVKASYIPALELFLERGWDLNAAIRHPPQPPPLAYVEGTLSFPLTVLRVHK